MVETVGSGYTSFGAYVRDQQSRAKGEPAPAAGRTIQDTVELSNGGKIVNVARGLDLAAQVKAEKDPTKIGDLIRAGTSDIKRIGRLFTEVIKTGFSAFRTRA